MRRVWLLLWSGALVTLCLGVACGSMITYSLMKERIVKLQADKIASDMALIAEMTRKPKLCTPKPTGEMTWVMSH